MKNKNLSATRQSNIELFRIITMLAIIAHHYVTNSGLTAADGPIFADPLSGRSLFLLLLGAWGKTGINCFVLITGYFMCTSQITLKKFMKLVLEVLFYRVSIHLIFLVSGKAPFSLTELVKVFLPVSEITVSFTGSFLCFYLCIPFLNILIRNLREGQHIRLLLLCSFIYIFFGTIKVLPLTMNYVSWFIVLYFFASYLRLYPKKLFSNTVFWGLASVLSLVAASASVVVCTFIGAKIGRNSPYAFVADSNTFLAVTTAVCVFLFFANLNIRQSKWINTISGTTFGVFLLHTSGSALRNWLWNDVCNSVGAYASPYLPLWFFLSVFGVFTVCSLIDLLRQYVLEKPFFRLWDRHYPKFLSGWNHLLTKLRK